MSSFSLKQIELNKDYSATELGIVKKFYVKFDTIIGMHKFTLLCGGTPLAKTSKLVYDQSHQMWEIKFYSVIVSLFDSPPGFSDCLLFNLAHCHNVRICSKNRCDLFVETCNPDGLATFPAHLFNVGNTQEMCTYVEYADPYFHIKVISWQLDQV
uniref:Uncharacterized protein n=1 Tax=viral metagenome TaxID=1070528 RepID=A0A6C0BJL4_9ZZZZ